MFETRINEYQLREDGVGELVRRKTELVLYLNTFDKHFTINDFQTYAKVFVCRTCGSVLTSKFPASDTKRKTGGVEFNYTGGVFQPPLNVFERLEDYGIELPPNLNRFYPFCATYDIECLMKNDVARADSDKQRWVAEHELMSVSVCSNVPDHEEPQCFISNGDPAKLTDTLLEYLLKISTKAFECLQQMYQPIVHILEEKIEKYNLETGKTDTPYKTMHQSLMNR